MADYDVFVQVAETTVKTYRVRVTNSAKGMAEPVANAALRRALEYQDERFEVTATTAGRPQLLTSVVMDVPG
jgi:hypothetical protein